MENTYHFYLCLGCQCRVYCGVVLVSVPLLYLFRCYCVIYSGFAILLLFIFFLMIVPLNFICLCLCYSRGFSCVLLFQGSCFRRIACVTDRTATNVIIHSEFKYTLPCLSLSPDGRACGQVLCLFFENKKCKFDEQAKLQKSFEL